MAEGDFHSLSLKQPMVPDWGLGMQQGESRACGPRVVKGKCSQMLPSVCTTAFPKYVQ